MKNPIRLMWLDQQEMDQVHSETLTVLWESGIKINHPKAKAMLQSAGAKVYETTGMIRLPAELVEWAIMQVPQNIVMAGRESENDLILDDNSLPLTRSVNGVEGYHDLANGQYRLATCSDVVEFTRLIDGMLHPQICCSMLACDAPHLKIRDLTTVKLMMQNTVKHVCISVDDVQQFRAMIEMAEVIRGDKAALRQRPIFSVLTSVTSPRHMLDYCIDMILLAGQNGIPVMINSSPLMGTTAPVTIAGCLIQCNVEILALLTLSQVANPGSPVIYRHLPMTIDMASGSPIVGSPECVMATGALSQLVREKYHLHTDTFGTVTDAVIGDAQAQIECTMLTLIAALSGSSVLSGAGEFGDGMSMDPVKLVIDSEIFSSVLRCLSGFDVNTETCAGQLIQKVMPGMDYLSNPHTLEHFRSEHQRSKLFVSQTANEWADAGSKDTANRARAAASDILAEHQVTPLEAGVCAEMDIIYKRYLDNCVT